MVDPHVDQPTAYAEFSRPAMEAIDPVQGLVKTQPSSPEGRGRAALNKVSAHVSVCGQPRKTQRRSLLIPHKSVAFRRSRYVTRPVVDVGVIIVVIGSVIVDVHVNVNPTVEVIDVVVGDSWLTPSTSRITATVSFPFTCTSTITASITITPTITLFARNL
jgi:hypothetical protein